MNQYISRTLRNLLRSLYITAGVFLFVFSIFHVFGALYVSSISKESINAFNSGIKSDLQYLKEKGDDISKDEKLAELILSKNATALVDYLQEKRNKYSIGLMGATDAKGVILSRTRTASKVGDNVFLTSPAGRVLAQENHVESVEETSAFDPHQLFLTTGRHVIRDGKMIGSLFANYLTDDEYAKAFKTKYLPAGVEVIFYNKNAGIYGESFNDPEIHRLTNSYFNSGSEWIKDGMSSKTIELEDGRFFFVENVIFPGLEKSPGGALIFVPRRDISRTASVIITMLTLLVFLLLSCFGHKNSYGEEKGWKYIMFVCVVGLPAILLAFFILRLQNIGYLRLEHIPYTLYNSTLRFQPEFGIYDVGSEQSFSIVVDTGDEAINAVEAKVLFDPNKVFIRSLDANKSSCAYFIENKINETKGEAIVSCVVLKKGGETGSINVADIILVPKTPGGFSLEFDKEDTKVLASDGLGTNVLRMSQSGSYSAEDFGSSFVDKNSNQSSISNQIVVFSPTHPNQGRWYNSNNAYFVWLGDRDSAYAYSLDGNPTTIPTGNKVTLGNSITLPISGDGILYFHIKSAVGDFVTHYKIQSDRTPPMIKSMLLSSNNIVVGDVVRFLFEAEDIASGVEGNYYVDLGSHLFLPIGSQLFVPFLESGDQNITLRVYDKAGNYSEKTQTVKVKSPRLEWFRFWN